MRIFNTLTGRKEELEPAEPGHLRMYTCGPTVYNFAHIGNFRTFVTQDLLRRWILYRGLRLTHVMNITDVDDKTIANSRAQGESLQTYTERYARAFTEDSRVLNLQPPEVTAYATHHIDGMVQLVEQLLARDMAYRKDGSIYFRIAAFPGYGRLSRLDPEHLQTGHSVEADEYSKDNPRDFVLWKAARAGEPSWETRLGPGRPGWHLECSAMSMRYLGPSFDLHGGGVDLVFPHHENEIAQSEGATGRPFVRYWFHTEHLVVDGEKMSKSKGNFYTLRDLLDRGFQPRAIRWLLLSTHYRKPLNFTLEGIEHAGAALETLQNFLRLVRTGRTAASGDPQVAQILQREQQHFEDAMDDDLNISGALAAVFDARYQLNAIGQERGFSPSERDAVFSLFSRFNRVLDVLDFEADTLGDEQIRALIEERALARRQRDFARADQIRASLAARGVALEDTPDGVRWKITR